MTGLLNAQQHPVINIRAHTMDTVLNIPAPAFTVRDLDGKEVSLSDYKGKVVVLDFWATWCEPCQKSFPGMQELVTKYKDDPEVKIFFVDTREKKKEYKDLVRKFLAEHHYTFQVLLDDQGSGPSEKTLYTQYDMPGIPTKYIIDKAGHIRFKDIGFRPGTTADELSAKVSKLIETAKKS